MASRCKPRVDYLFHIRVLTLAEGSTRFAPRRAAIQNYFSIAYARPREIWVFFLNSKLFSSFGLVENDVKELPGVETDPGAVTRVPGPANS